MQPIKNNIFLSIGRVPTFAWLALLSVAAFATRAVVARGGSAHLSMCHLFVLQSLLAMPVLASMAKYQGASLRPNLAGNRFDYAVRIIAGITTTLFLMYALKLMPTALASTLSCTAPLFTALLAPWLLKEKTTPQIVAVTVLGFCGAGLAAVPYLKYLSLMVLGVGIMAGASGAFLQIYLRKLASRGEPGIRGVFWMHALSLVFGLGACLVTHELEFSKSELLVCSFTAILSVIAQVSNSAAYAKGRALPVNALSFLTLPVSVVLSAIFLGEAVPGNVMFSMMVTMPSCLALVWLEQRHLRQIHDKKARLSVEDIREEHAQEQHSMAGLVEPLFETEPVPDEYAAQRTAKTSKVAMRDFDGLPKPKTPMSGQIA